MSKKHYIIPRSEASSLMPYVICASGDSDFPDYDHGQAPARRVGTLRTIGSLNSIGSVRSIGTVK